MTKVKTLKNRILHNPNAPPPARLIQGRQTESPQMVRPMPYRREEVIPGKSPHLKGKRSK
jgi:hypothetical protein